MKEISCFGNWVRRVFTVGVCLAIGGLFPFAAGAFAETGSPSHEAAPHDANSFVPDCATNAPSLDAAVIANFKPVRFSDIFVTPAGPKGLEYTKTIRSLAGQPVRVTGFMVRQVSKNPAAFMLAEYPVSTMEHEYGVADGVPPNVVHALVPEKTGFGTAWQPYALTVYGRLELGGREEADGRMSYARIQVEHITVGTNNLLMDVMQPLGEREVNFGSHHHH